MDLEDTLRTYRLFSGSYDLVFGPVFHPGRKAAVRIANDRPHPIAEPFGLNRFLEGRLIDESVAAAVAH